MCKCVGTSAGLNPAWHDTLEFKVHVPQLAFVSFNVFAKNVPIAQYALPYRCIQQGALRCSTRPNSMKSGIVLCYSSTKKTYLLIEICYYYYCYFLTSVLNSRGMKKLHAMQYKKVQKSRWNEPYSSSSFTKQSCSKMALYR